MALSEELLNKLACPVCKNKLIYEEKKERLVCQNCRVAYRIDNNVPVLLADETEKL